MYKVSLRCLLSVYCETPQQRGSEDAAEASSLVANAIGHQWMEPMLRTLLRLCAVPTAILLDIKKETRLHGNIYIIIQ